MVLDNGEYREDYIQYENLFYFTEYIKELIELFKEMNIQ